MPDRWPSRLQVTRKVAWGLRKRLERLRAATERLRDEDDARAIHDFRVAARRLSEMLWMWKPILRGREADRLRRRLRRRRRELGGLRELEVHVELLRRVRSAADPAAPARLRDRLDDRRRRERHAARKVRGRSIALKEVEGLVEPSITWDEARGQIEARRERLRSRVVRRFEAVRSGSDDSRAHRARIALRRWRYALEGLAEVGVKSAQDGELPTLPPIQEALGAVQDLATLAEILKRHRSAGLHELRMDVLARLKRRRAAARRVVTTWLDHHGPGVAAAVTAERGPSPQRRTTRSAVPPDVTAPERGSRSEDDSVDA